MNFGNFFNRRIEDKKIADEFRSATHFRMDDADRAQIRDRLIAYTALKPIRSGARLAPRATHSLFPFAFHPVPLLALGLIFTVGAGSVSAAESALPGDVLYPIKVNVNEEVRAALARTPESRARVAIERAERRIQELKQLERAGVDETTFLEAETRLDEHVHDAEEKVLAANDANRADRERELVAILRTQESRLAVAETGGLSETEIASDTSFAAMTMIAPVPDEHVVTETEAMITSTPTEDSRAMMSVETAREDTKHIPEQTFEARTAERHLQETRMTHAGNEQGERVQKNIERQTRIAHDRVKSLEKLLEKMEKRSDDTSTARAGLQSAQDALQSADDARETNPAHASVLYAIAIKTAIDTRELLAYETAQNEDIRDKGDSEKRKSTDRENRDETREEDED